MIIKLIHVSVSQWLEQRARNASVLGSSTSIHTNFIDVPMALSAGHVNSFLCLAFFIESRS